MGAFTKGKHKWICVLKANREHPIEVERRLVNFALRCRREPLFVICSSRLNACKHFPSDGERLRRAWAEEFHRRAPLHSGTISSSSPSSTLTPSAFTSYRSARLPGVLSAVCSPDLFTSLIMDSGPDLSFPCRRPAGVSFRITTLT